MPIVAMPDGAQVSFPDDMSSDQIRSMILKKFPDAEKQAATPAGQQPAQAPQNTSSWGDVLSSIPHALLSSVAGAMKQYGGGANAETGGYYSPEYQQAQNVLNTDPQQFEQKLEQQTTGPLPQPQTAAGRMVTDALAPVADPAAYVGPGGPVRALLSSLAASGMSSGAGEAASAMGATPQQETAARLITAALAPTFAGKSPEGPSVAALKNEGGAAYDELRNGTPFATANSSHAPWAQNELADLAQGNKGATAFDNPAPRTTDILNTVANKNVMTASDYDALKGALRRVTQDGGSDADAARGVINSLHDQIAGFDKGQTGVYGDADRFKQLWSDANANYAAGLRKETVENTLGNALEAARDDASGLNVGNKIRQAFKPLLKNDAEQLRFSGFSPQEIAATRGIGRGIPMNLMRYGSNVLGGGGGIGSLIAGTAIGSGGVAAEGPMGGFAAPAAMLAGLALRHGYNTITRNRAENLARMVGARSPLGGNALPAAQQAILLKRLLNAGQQF